MLPNESSRDLIAMPGGSCSRRLRITVLAAVVSASALSPLQASPVLVLSPDGVTVYDPVTNVTWIADGNFAAFGQFGLPQCDRTTTDRKSCVNPSGSMRYEAAVAWVKAMNAANYLGHSNWQLPTTPSLDSGCGRTGPNANSFGFGCSASAYGSLFYNGLGLQAPNSAVSVPRNSVGPFSEFQPYLYWSQTSAGGNGYASFSFNSGFQGANTAPNFLYVLPMIPGRLPGAPAAAGTGLEVDPGGQTVYDPLTNVTWLANANLAASDSFGLPRCITPTSPTVCVNQDGAMTWNAATQLIANMNAFGGTGYLGQTNWQLPPVDPNCTGYNCNGNASPMGELFYGQLGLSQGTPVVTVPNIAVGPFNNLQPYLYWGCEGATIQGPCQSTGPAPNFEWSFSFGNGFEGTDLLQNDLYATAYFVGSRTPPMSIWLPVASHGGGLNGSQWRSDVGVLNPSPATANLQVVLHASGGTKMNTTYVPSGSQAILTDIVNQLGTTGSGALEIQSDQPVVVSSRTYNQSGNGTFGQDYASYNAASVLGAGQSAWLPQLTENAAYRTNISLTNTGIAAATVSVTLLDGAGNALTTYIAALNPGEWQQAVQPFKNKANQTVMDRGYAKVTVTSGSGVIASASVIDNSTNDPTTIPMHR